MQHLQSFSENIKGMLPIKQAEKAYYQQFSVFLDRYEETKNKASAQLGAMAQVQLISGQGSDNLKQKLEAIST
jgi:ribosomal protein L13